MHGGGGCGCRRLVAGWFEKIEQVALEKADGALGAGAVCQRTYSAGGRVERVTGGRVNRAEIDKIARFIAAGLASDLTLKPESLHPKED